MLQVKGVQVVEDKRWWRLANRHPGQPCV